MKYFKLKTSIKTDNINITNVNNHEICGTIGGIKFSLSGDIIGILKDLGANTEDSGGGETTTYVAHSVPFFIGTLDYESSIPLGSLQVAQFLGNVGLGFSASIADNDYLYSLYNYLLDKYNKTETITIIAYDLITDAENEPRVLSDITISLSIEGDTNYIILDVDSESFFLTFLGGSAAKQIKIY